MPSEDLLQMAKKLRELEEEKANKKKEYDDADYAYSTHKINLYDKMTAEECPSFTLTGIGKFSQSSRSFNKVMNEFLLIEYLDSIGKKDEIMQLKPVMKRLNEYIKEEFIEKGRPVPESEMGVYCTLTPTVSVRRA